MLMMVQQFRPVRDGYMSVATVAVPRKVDRMYVVCVGGGGCN